MIFNAAHLHLMLNHIPVFAAFFGSAIAAYVTGSLAEDSISHIAGVFEDAIDGHEDAGKVTLAVSIVTAAVAGFAWIRDARAFAPRWIQATVLALGIAGFLAGGYTAFLGGLIHHQEIRMPHASGSTSE